MYAVGSFLCCRRSKEGRVCAPGFRVPGEFFSSLVVFSSSFVVFFSERRFVSDDVRGKRSGYLYAAAGGFFPFGLGVFLNTCVHVLPTAGRTARMLYVVYGVCVVRIFFVHVYWLRVASTRFCVGRDTRCVTLFCGHGGESGGRSCVVYFAQVEVPVARSYAGFDNGD